MPQRPASGRTRRKPPAFTVRPLGQGVTLEVPADFTIAGTPGLECVTVCSATAKTTYWDTADLRLLRWGHRVRHREATDGSEAGWTVTIGTDAATASTSVEVDVEGGGRKPPRPTTNLLAAIVRGEPLRRVATLVTDQHTLELRRDGVACVRLTDELLRPLVDRGHGAEMPSSRLLELELLEGGHESDVREITAHLRREGARPNPAAPLSFLPFCENTQPPEPAAPKLRRSASVRVLVAAAIGDGTLRLLRHDPRVRLSEDVEAVHQARVATRRLRSDLRTLAPLLDRAQVSRLRDELAWIGAQLGEVRDLDVLSARLRDQLGDLADPDEEGAPQPAGADELTAVLEREAAVRRAVLLDVLDSARYRQLIDDLVAAADNPPLAPGLDPEAPAPDVVRRIARRPWRRLIRSIRHLPDDPPDSALHEVRKRSKQMRYASELVSPLAGKRADQLASRLADVQDVLGELQDADVAAEWLRRTSGTLSSTDAAFVAGELCRLQAEERARARRAWRTEWRSARKKKLRAWMN